MNNNLSKISDFSYDLPDEKIAKHPLPNRDESKLLIWKQGKIIDETFSNCIKYLPKNSLVIFNDTRVIHARIILTKSTGARIEILCLEPFEPHNYEQSFAQIGKCSWKCVVGNAKKWKNEPLQAVIQGDNDIHFLARKENQTEDGFSRFLPIGMTGAESLGYEQNHLDNGRPALGKKRRGGAHGLGTE